MPRAAKNVVPKKQPKKKNGYVMPESIPLGEVLTDLSKKQWKVGRSIGKGGFGEIYTACRADKPPKNIDDYEYVVKIEPHGNGPLFVEMHFYMRNAKEDDIKNFAKQKKIKNIGMPYLIGSGSHDVNGQKHRFIIMPRYGKDIWHYFLENGKKLPEHTGYRLALQMLDVYEYIHNCTYIHADLKGANILLGFGKSGLQQAYLVDFGLASHYTTKDFKPDPKKMHNGTIEYTSRDAHLGIPTMRGDFEILGYNLIHWSGVSLPWEAKKLLSNPSQVQKAKEAFMQNTQKSLEELYGKNIPEPIKQYFEYISTLQYNDKPDYEKCRKMFVNGLKLLNKSNSGDLEFKLSSVKSPISKTKAKSPISKTEAKSPISKTKAKLLAIDSPISVDDDSKNQDNDNDSENENDESDNDETIDPSPKPVQKRTALTRNAITRSPIKRKKSSSNSPSPKKQKQTVLSRSPNSLLSNKQPKINTPKTPINTSTPVINLRKHIHASSSAKKPGKTIINDNLTPNPKSKKTYEFNFELDVSMDANVIINVKRKKAKKDENKSTPQPKVNIRRVKTPVSTNKNSSVTSPKTRSAK